MVVFQIVQQHLAHGAFTAAMAQQQHRICLGGCAGRRYRGRGGGWGFRRCPRAHGGAGLLELPLRQQGYKQQFGDGLGAALADGFGHPARRLGARRDGLG